jgi:hypothetical protein
MENRTPDTSSRVAVDIGGTVLAAVAFIGLWRGVLVGLYRRRR